MKSVTPEPHLTRSQKLRIGTAILRVRIKEYLNFDSRLAAFFMGAAGLVTGVLLYTGGRVRHGFGLLARLHRSNYLGAANTAAEALARLAAVRSREGRPHALLAAYGAHVGRSADDPRWAAMVQDPTRLLGPLVLVLQSPEGARKGVLLLQYSYVFPLFARLFDLDAVAARYHLVLEPDWSGYCDPNVLCYSRYSFPVFVQAYEPRDAQFLDAIGSNLVRVPTSTNWWVDHRLFRPDPEIQKDVDVMMIAAWAPYKRHFALFAAMRTLRQRGILLRTLLLGYPAGYTKDDILRQAMYYGVADQIEQHEWVPYDEVSSHVNRAKVNVIWSRKEGVNRAIVEGMFADVPCVLREGFNYGYRYPYVNEQTGRFTTERDLPETLLQMVESYRAYKPREWVLANLSCQRATELLGEAIRKTTAAAGEDWESRLAVKVNKLHGMEYWDPADKARFEADYAFLRSVLRRSQDETPFRQAEDLIPQAPVARTG